jgi:hypothetical protein
MTHSKEMEIIYSQLPFCFFFSHSYYHTRAVMYFIYRKLEKRGVMCYLVTKPSFKICRALIQIFYIKIWRLKIPI